MKIVKSKVSFLSGGKKLKGTLLIPKTGQKKLPGVVFYHGRGSSQKKYIARAEPVAKKGIVCLVFDFSGCGESDGDFLETTIKGGVEDALSGFDFLLKQKLVDKDRMGICGRSYGGYLAALVSQERRVKSLILSVPAIYKDDWEEISYERLPIKEIKIFHLKDDFDDNKAIKAIEKFKGNLLVIGHEKDEIIPEYIVRAYFNFAKKAKEKKITFIKGAGHLLDRPKFNAEFKRLILRWFERTLVG
jgi:dipeptidyl aminopeptidase/acylaminoacyl peptidase